MRLPAAILAAALVLASFGCGGKGAATATEETSAASAAEERDAINAAPQQAASTLSKTPAPLVVAGDDPRLATISAGEGQRAKPEVDPPDRPPPREFLSRDIEVGTGPVARDGDELGVWYLGFDYETGKEVARTWPPAAAWPLQLGAGGSGDAFEKGIEGMRVGGRRELVIPKRLMFTGVPTIYVIELARVGPPPEESGGG